MQFLLLLVLQSVRSESFNQRCRSGNGENCEKFSQCCKAKLDKAGCLYTSEQVNFCQSTPGAGIITQSDCQCNKLPSQSLLCSESSTTCGDFHTCCSQNIFCTPWQDTVNTCNSDNGVITNVECSCETSSDPTKECKHLGIEECKINPGKCSTGSCGTGSVPFSKCQSFGNKRESVSCKSECVPWERAFTISDQPMISCLRFIDCCKHRLICKSDEEILLANCSSVVSKHASLFCGCTPKEKQRNKAALVQTAEKISPAAPRRQRIQAGLEPITKQTSTYAPSIAQSKRFVETLSQVVEQHIDEVVASKDNLECNEETCITDRPWMVNRGGKSYHSLSLIVTVCFLMHGLV